MLPQPGHDLYDRHAQRGLQAVRRRHRRGGCRARATSSRGCSGPGRKPGSAGWCCRSAISPTSSRWTASGLALCTDGVGSKTMIADMMGKYDTIGIDCVAMNVNDMICVGAKPLSMVDYIAVERTDAAMLDAIGVGLCEGARRPGSRSPAARPRSSRHRQGLRSRRHGGRPRGARPGDRRPQRARRRRRHRRTQQRRPQQRLFAGAPGVLRQRPATPSTTSSTSSACRSARNCCVRPTSTCRRRWRSSTRSPASRR